MLKKFFIKRFKTYFLYTLIPTLLMFIVMAFILNFFIQRELTKQAENNLSAVETNIELVINNALNQHELMMAKPRLTLSLQKLLSHQSFEYSDVIFLNSLKAALNSIVLSHTYIESVYLYLDRNENFLTSTTENLAAISDYYDKEWYTLYSENQEDVPYWIVKRWIQEYEYAEKVHVISIFQRMKFSKGVIVMNINQKKLMNMINDLINDQNMQMLLFNPEGELLLSSRDSENAEKMLPTILASRVGKWNKIDGKYYLLHKSEELQYGLGLYSVIPFTAYWIRFQGFIGIAVSVLLLNLSLVYFFAYITTKRVFRQIDYMIKVFDDAEKGIMIEKSRDILKDEFDIIMNNIIFLFLKSNTMKNQLIERKYKQEIAELAALQHQINPHFLFNAMQTLDLEIRSQHSNSPHLSLMVQNISSILKYALVNPIEQVKLSEELQYLKSYIEVEKYRFGDKFIMYYEIDEALKNCFVFRLMLQPLIENSIHHGIRMLEHNGFIKLKIRKDKEEIKIHIIDTGKGLTREKVKQLYARFQDEDSKNIGLTNVNRRLVIRYGERAGIRILSKEGLGTSISFRIPIQY